MKNGARIAGLVAALSALTIDQLTKQVAVATLSGALLAPTNFLNLRLGLNEGVSFGLFADFFSGRPLLLAAAMSAIAMVLLAWLWRTRVLVESLALGMIVGGALGNIADRLRIGAVVDFLDFHIADYHWPAFNLADTSIVLGVALLAFASFTAGARSNITPSSSSPVRATDWAFFSAIGLAAAAVILMVLGYFIWAIVAAVAATILGWFAWVISRGRPGPMPHLFRWVLLLPRGNHSPKHLVACLGPEAGERILEIGPGIGVHALPVATALGANGRLCVTDIQQGMLDDLMLRASKAGIENIRPTAGSAERLAYPDASFDGAYLVTVLGEIPNRKAVLSELRRVLKPGSRIVIGEMALDPDFIPLKELIRAMTAAGFSFERNVGPRFSYLARFRSDAATSSESSG